MMSVSITHLLIGTPHDWMMKESVPRTDISGRVKISPFAKS